MAASHSRIDRLHHLQNVIKRDPTAYRDEFLLQYRNYKAEMEIFALNPSSEAKSLIEVVAFISHVASCYPKETEDFAEDIMGVLSKSAALLH
ncbi:Mys45A, partial [Symbiodinium sp. KB8]